MLVDLPPPRPAGRLAVAVVAAALLLVFAVFVKAFWHFCIAPLFGA